MLGSICFIVATFNEENSISDTVGSIQANMSGADRLVIMDGISQDSTLEKVNKIAASDNRIVVRSEKDNGIYDAWNKAIQNNTCDWLSFVGSGDILSKNYREDLSKTLEQSTEINFIHCYARKFLPIGTQCVLLGRFGADFNAEVFKFRMRISHVGALHHRSLFDEFNFSTEHRCVSDYEFLLRHIDNLRAHFVPKELVFMEATGISSRSINIFFEELKMKSKLGDQNMIGNWFWMIPRIIKRLYVITELRVVSRLPFAKRINLKDLPYLPSGK